MTFTDNEKAIINSSDSVKLVRLEFPDGESDTIGEHQIYQESLNLEESIFEGDNLTFGKCNGSIFKIRVADFTENIENARMNVYVKFTHEELGEVDVPFGKYIVSSVERTSDRRWRDITATDYMSLFDVDIAEWYNNTLYPTSDTTRTVKEIRTMLCAYIGVDQEEITLINDDLVIGKTIEPQSVNARDLLKAVCELNTCFGHFDWSGVLKYITIEFDGLFPSDTLYPSSDLYPRASHSNGVDTEYILQYKQDGCEYADYDVQDIDSVAIMKEDGDLAVHAEIGQTYTNRYNIVGNFLLYGFSTEELEDIAETILNKICDCSYRPNTTTVFGGVYMEMGQDYVVNARTYVGTEIIDKKFHTYLLKRTITGIQAMFSTLEAMGDQYQPKTPTYDVDRQLKALQGKSASISKDLEGLKVEYHDFEQQTNSKFVQTADEITTEVAKTQGTWLEEYPTGTKINIKYKNYGTPKSSYPNAEFEEMDFSDGDYYLDVSTGRLYQGTVSGATLTTVLINWRLIKTLPRVEEHLSSSIDQTAESITSTVSKSTKTWLEEHPVGTPITIDYYGYGNPPTLPTSDSEYYSVSLNDLYLDGEEGKVYKCTDIQYVEIPHGSAVEIRKQFTWTYQYTLEGNIDEAYSRIEQTATAIVLSVNENGELVLVELTADREEGAAFTVKATNISLQGKTLNLTSDDMTISSTNFNVTKEGYTDITAPYYYILNNIGQDVTSQYTIEEIAITNLPVWGDENIGKNVILLSTEPSVGGETSGGVYTYQGRMGNEPVWSSVVALTAKVGIAEFKMNEDGMSLISRMFTISENGDATFKGTLNINGNVFEVDKYGNLSINNYFKVNKLGALNIGDAFTVDTSGNATATKFKAIDSMEIQDSGESSTSLVGRMAFEVDRTMPTNPECILTLSSGSLDFELRDVTGTGFIGGYAIMLDTSSDYRLKENFKDISENYERAYYELQPLLYNFIGQEKTELGLIAQEVEKICDKYKIDNIFVQKYPDEKLGERYSIDYRKFVAYNMHIIQKQNKEIKSLKDDLATLKQQVAFLMQGGK